jgi:hypothetical protein
MAFRLLIVSWSWEEECVWNSLTHEHDQDQSIRLSWRGRSIHRCYGGVSKAASRLNGRWGTLGTLAALEGLRRGCGTDPRAHRVDPLQRCAPDRDALSALVLVSSLPVLAPSTFVVVSRRPEISGRA